MIYLKEILHGLKYVSSAGLSGVKISGIACDSRMVKKRDLFIATKGPSSDGYDFIKDAIANGASAVLSDRDFDVAGFVTKILVSDARAALPVISANFYGNPCKDLKIIGVTGTNGKTTITYIIENIIKSAGKDAGVIGTINYRFKDRVIEAKNTTPGTIELERLIRSMADAGVGYVAMEASSHSLSQGRVDGILFDAGIFTNITKEHLDYHITIAKYFKAKSGLFDRLKKTGVAVLNADDKRVAGLKSVIKNKAITYGLYNRADVRATELKLSLEGSSFIVVTPQSSFRVSTKLAGEHNVSNILASVAAAGSIGISARCIKKGIESFGSVPGRLEEVMGGQPFKVFIDFAHTEDALFNVLNILRKSAKNNLITVFGCGGNRDKNKRPLMGRVACKFSDRVIITSDNPRFESPKDIIDEIELGVKREYSNYCVVEDRRKAIEKAVQSAGKGDIVIIAGKGHEKYQIIKDKVTPFDDNVVAREAIRKSSSKWHA